MGDVEIVRGVGARCRVARAIRRAKAGASRDLNTISKTEVRWQDVLSPDNADDRRRGEVCRWVSDGVRCRNVYVWCSSEKVNVRWTPKSQFLITLQHPTISTSSPHHLAKPSTMDGFFGFIYPQPDIYTMAFRASRTLLSLRTIATPRVIPASRTFTVAVRPTPAFRPVSLGYRYKSTERSAWAREPIISYEELKPITQQPNDVSHLLYDSAGQ
jgi:hypothetical protein